jgi:hypothetical protein
VFPNTAVDGVGEPILALVQLLLMVAVPTNAALIVFTFRVWRPTFATFAPGLSDAAVNNYEGLLFVALIGLIALRCARHPPSCIPLAVMQCVYILG